MKAIVLSELGTSLVALAASDGWLLRSKAGEELDLSRHDSWPSDVLATPTGRRAAVECDQLLDLEIAESENGAIRIPWDRFGEVLPLPFELPLRGTAPCPLMLRIDGHSQVSRDDFRYRYQYLLAAREVAVERCGYVVRRTTTDQLFHLDEQTYGLVSAMDAFNQLSPNERKTATSWLTLATVKGCASAVGATLDAALESNDVIVPSQLALGMLTHEDGSLSFYPVCDGLSEDDLREAFFRNLDAKGLYSLDGSDGKRVRVVLGERHRLVLERMKQAQALRGKERERARTDPASYFDGLLDSIDIRYGERVIGIGELPNSTMPKDPSAGGEFLEGAPKPNTNGSAETGGPTRITLASKKGIKIAELDFGSREELKQAQAELSRALLKGITTVQLLGQDVPVTREVLAAFDDALGASAEQGGKGKGDRKFLLVYTNEETLKETDIGKAERASRPPPVDTTFRLPDSLLPSEPLKRHQLEGLAWLGRCASLRPDRQGVLLADEMGLGKTLQVLAFLANQIEQGALRSSPKVSNNLPPWRPILIVAPLILVESETWQDQMRKFFASDGDVFGPILTLHGEGVDRVKADGAKGSETVIGRPILDAGKLMQYRTVITNYETVVTYQHSLAQLFDGKRPLWSVLVADEVQRCKSPSTKVSVALKAISADFRIAATGTPVENRLLDLWNIVDAFQPALLGNAGEFSKAYEKPAAQGESGPALVELRDKLLYGRPHAYLLRRAKDEIAHDMPSKLVEHVICEMSDEERHRHDELVSALGEERRRGRHLSVLQRLVELYQHPALGRDREAYADTRRLIADSSKLRGVLQKLREIRAKGEKAIIFARLIDMQQILQQVISEEFRIPVPIINGATSRNAGARNSSAGTLRAKETRKQILDEYRERPGFGVMVLSPFVAGIGLTIVEANHVFHYGRWWNPAVEAQATDRVHRIGQTKPVMVYLPILTDATGAIGASFDERLDNLMLRKTKLAQDFLSPGADENACANELCDEILSGGVTKALGGAPFTQRELDELDSADFEAAVGALYAAEGYQVILTANAGDGGADLLVLRGEEGILVQTKHSASQRMLDDSAINDVIGAADVYGSRLRLSRRRLVVASNGPAPPVGIRGAADQSGVELLVGRDLIERMTAGGVGLGAMAACAATRCRTFEEGVLRARELIGSPRPAGVPSARRRE